MSKFWQKKYISKYTGAEIDAAVAKAGTVPTVTEADAGKALVVDEEGKIVPGEAGGISSFQNITNEMITPIAINFSAFLAAANDTIQVKVFNIYKNDNPEIYESFKNIIDIITNNYAGFNYISLMDNTVYFPVFRIKEHAVSTMSFATGHGSTLILWLSYNETTIVIEGYLQKNNSL